MYLVLLLSGILTALPLLFEVFAPLSFFSMIPLMILLFDRKPCYRYLLVWGIGYYGLLYHWFLYLYPMEFAGFNTWQSIGVIALAWIGLTGLQAPEIALAAPILRACTKKEWRCYRLLAPFVFAAAFTLLEWLQTQTWLGVPLLRLALSQTAALPVIQSASLFGSLFITFLIVSVNGLLAVGILALRENHTWRSGFPIALAALLFAVNYLFGVVSIACSEKDEDTVTVALIQGNVSTVDKWANNSLAHTMEVYLSLTAQAVEEVAPQLVVWPETVVNTVVRNNQKYMKMLSDCAREHQITLIVGTFDAQSEAGEQTVYNALMCFYPDGTLSDTVYYKRHLVPFGEYLPMEGFIRAVLPSLAELNLFADPLTPGEQSSIFETAFGKIGGLVCYDSIYDVLARQSVQDGAQMLVLATNDSWYRDSAAGYQHCRHAVLRAVENGRYLAQSASTGISAVITPQGEITASLGPLCRGYVSSEIAARTSRTLYSYLGDTFVALCAVYCVGCGVARWICSKKPKQDKCQ